MLTIRYRVLDGAQTGFSRSPENGDSLSSIGRHFHHHHQLRPKLIEKVLSAD